MPAFPQVLALLFLLVGAVLAQYAAPAWPGFHAWQYAALLSLLMLAFCTKIGSKQPGSAAWARAGRKLFAGGGLLVGIAGLLSGLLGPDSTTIVGTPGTVAPLPDLGAAAFFPSVDAEAIARGDTVLLLRRRNGGSLSVEPGRRRFLGSSALEQAIQPAAYIEARDMQGRRLTVTQPKGNAFLSPVLLFPSTVQIEGRTLPSDSFAVPALRRHVEAIFLSPKTGRKGVLFVVHDEAGGQVAGGVVLGRSGQEVHVGGMRVRATSGSYPALSISAIPPRIVVGLGLLLLLLGAAGVAFGRARLPCSDA